MNKLLTNTLVSALVGGVVGASVVFFASGQKFDKLEVHDLTVTGEAKMKSGDDDKQPEVVIKNGSIIVSNVVVATRMVSTQMQGHVFVANRILTSPDDLIKNANTQWKFFTEIGSSHEQGGEIIVRSATGSISGNKLENIPSNGWMFRAGYTNNQPDIVFFSNETKEVMPIVVLKQTDEPITATGLGTGKTAANVNTPPNTPNNLTLPANTNITTPPINHSIIPTPQTGGNTANTANTNSQFHNTNRNNHTPIPNVANTNKIEKR
ncbi:MAG: hypothetical protein LBH59_00010 [Planctomycetaceae bacterium]|jgi:hypothetical protein|nr:hypothetical protein [Planctomycetaceae bacterium]